MAGMLETVGGTIDDGVPGAGRNSSAAAGAERTAPDGAAGEPKRAWWRNSVAYQVYVRSFKDSNGDGLGDLAGVREALPALADMGVGAVWLNPCYPSPQHDHGYDIADYRGINPDYGTFADFDALVETAHSLGVRVLMDIVPNHSSNEHAWFREALAAAPGSPARDRFLFAEGEGADGSEPPNDWTSIFGGPAWDRVDDGTENPQWYLHLFDSTQPDFNWRNPEVRAEFLSVLAFWFDRGVDGFRIDVAHGLVKAPEFPRGRGVDQSALWTQPELFDVYREWRELAESYDPPKYFVGEAWVDDPASLARFTAPGELQQSFAFDLLVQPWFAHRLRASIQRSLDVAGAEDGPAWALANHDVFRLVTRLGQVPVDKDPDPFDMLADARRRTPVDLALGVRRARAGAALMLALPGTAFVYQGEELGLDEVLDLPDEAREDPMWIRTGGAEIGRDGCRVPLPWTSAGSSMGFGPEGGAAPWLPQPDRFRALARDVQEADPDSMLALYRRLARLRPSLLGDAHRVEWIDVGAPSVLAFRAGELVCATNTGAADEAFDAPEGAEFLLNTAGASAPGVLAADSTSWWRLPR